MTTYSRGLDILGAAPPSPPSAMKTFGIAALGAAILGGALVWLFG